MAAKSIEIADVVRAFQEPYRRQYGDRLLPSHRRALQDILACMTPEMGGARYQCADCSETFWSYHGCRNRACPRCHGRQISTWIQERTAQLLPCEYFHVVATVPEELRSLFLREQKLCYGILMKVAASSVIALAKEKRYIGAVPAIMAVLHTWTGQMHYHPHVHMLVSGGGLSQDGKTWHEAQPNFLVPVKKLSPMISQQFADLLRHERPDLFAQIPAKVWKREWCSFCKPVGTGREAVLQYLARYVFRIAITKNRILTMDETHVTFRYKENNTGKWKVERLPGVEFLRRFLLHVLPAGFHKVRYYGLWSAPNQSRHCAAQLQLQLAQKQAAPQPVIKLADLAEEALAVSEIENHGFIVKCPKCQSERVLCLERAPRGGAMIT
jgi:hypothetical protein